MSKILIVDDNKDITEMLGKYLRMKGFECTVSNDGHNGYNLIKNGVYDFIFLDMSMPDFSGPMIIDGLKKEGILKNNKIIIFTASSITNEQIDELLKNDGVITVLKKPVQLNELLTVISS